MYIFAPFQQNQENPYMDNFINALSVASFLIGLQNLELNITANDIDNQTQVILDDLHKYLDKQDRHLTEQDHHLSEQDRHLAEQDLRLMRLEKYLNGENGKKVYRQERSNKNG